MSLPRLGESIPRRGNAFSRAVGCLALRLMGWRIEGDFPDRPKLVVAVAPHTSNWDFVVGAAAMFALDLRLTFLGKHTLFRGPLAPLMRWMGGVPVDRAAAHGVVGEAVAAFARIPARVMAIAPEGTRSRVARFRTGFLHIARGAGVPVVLATLDYGARVVRIGPTLAVAADIEAERERIEAFFRTVRGRHVR